MPNRFTEKQRYAMLRAADFIERHPTQHAFDCGVILTDEVGPECGCAFAWVSTFLYPTKTIHTYYGAIEGLGLTEDEAHTAIYGPGYRIANPFQIATNLRTLAYRDDAMARPISP